METTNNNSNSSSSLDEETGEVIVFQGQSLLSKTDQTSPTKKKSNKKKKKPTSPNASNSQPQSSSSKNEEDTNNTVPLEDRILLQVEYYFSDNNLKNDKFMQQEMETGNLSAGQGPPEQQIPWSGWIRLETLHTFPKLQNFTKDLQVIREALKNSKRLVFSEDGSRIRRTCSYALNVNTPSAKLRKSDEKTLYISYLPKDFDRNKLSEMFSSLGIDASTIQRMDVPMKNVHVQAQGNSVGPATTLTEIKGVAFVEFGSKEDMKRALDSWKNGNNNSSEYSKMGIKMKPYSGNTTNQKTNNEQSPAKEEPSLSNTSPSKATSIYESSPVFNYSNSKSKRRPSLSDKDKQRWEPDPSASAMRPKLNLLPKGSSVNPHLNSDRSSPSMENGGVIHPIRQPKGPDSTSSRGFAKQQRGQGRGKLVL